MKKFRLFFPILFLVLALCVVLVGCSRKPLPEIEYTIFPKEGVSYKDNSVYVRLKDGFTLTDYSIFRTDSIGFESNKKDKYKPILIKNIDDLFNMHSFFYIEFADHNQEQILSVMNQWINLDIVESVNPKYIYDVVCDDFTPTSIPPNDYYYDHEDDDLKQWGLSSVNGIDIEGAWQYATADSTPRIK